MIRGDALRLKAFQSPFSAFELMLSDLRVPRLLDLPLRILVHIVDHSRDVWSDVLPLIALGMTQVNMRAMLVLST